MNIEEILGEKKTLFDDYMETYLAGFGSKSGIFEAFAYSLRAGGKRIRPILAMLACEALGGIDEQALPAGLAIEMIHTFSLIHDDLPALDNDDLRRGLPTCHAKFDEATAILAGDALIFQALSVIGLSNYPIEIKMDICTAMADVCGTDGLVQGEYEDVMAEGKDIPVSGVEDIYLKKTSRLFELSMFSGARLVSDNKQDVQLFVRYGRYLGLAFQAIDDILDVTSSEDVLGKTSGKDILQNKATLVKVLGLQNARDWAKEATHKAVESISTLDEKRTWALRNLAIKMLERVM